jgi:hypothetical protein
MLYLVFDTKLTMSVTRAITLQHTNEVLANFGGCFGQRAESLLITNSVSDRRSPEEFEPREVANSSRSVPDFSVPASSPDIENQYGQRAESLLTANSFGDLRSPPEFDTTPSSIQDTNQPYIVIYNPKKYDIVIRIFIAFIVLCCICGIGITILFVVPSILDALNPISPIKNNQTNIELYNTKVYNHSTISGLYDVSYKLEKYSLITFKGFNCSLNC